jgi:CrcB protein
MILKLLLIGCGGAAGAVLRYLVAGWGQALVAGSFPLGTLLVNVSGCLLIGVVGRLLLGETIVPDHYRFAILVGFLGGFTTFSTFGWETMALLNDGQRTAAIANVLLSNVLGLAAVWIGYRLVQLWPGA